MQVAMLVALHLLYAAIGFLDTTGCTKADDPHFSRKDWALQLGKVRISSIIKNPELETPISALS